jgi:hypothetical protein
MVHPFVTGGSVGRKRRSVLSCCSGFSCLDGEGTIACMRMLDVGMGVMIDLIM